MAALVRSARREIVECFLRDTDDMPGNEFCTLARPVLRVLEAAFPFQHGPGIVAVLRELGENGVEIHLSVSQRPEASGAADPAFITAVDANSPGRVELGILGVKRLDALVIEIDERDVVELLQQEMARVVIDEA